MLILSGGNTSLSLMIKQVSKLLRHGRLKKKIAQDGSMLTIEKKVKTQIFSPSKSIASLIIIHNLTIYRLQGMI